MWFLYGLFNGGIVLSFVICSLDIEQLIVTQLLSCLYWSVCFRLQLGSQLPVFFPIFVLIPFSNKHRTKFLDAVILCNCKFRLTVWYISRHIYVCVYFGLSIFLAGPYRDWLMFSLISQVCFLRGGAYWRHLGDWLGALLGCMKFFLFLYVMVKL